jgi:hypothetical protein
MKTPAFRAIALILLTVSLVSWTGLAATAAALCRPEADTCCGRSGDEESTNPLACSPQECPCFSCLPFESGGFVPFTSILAAGAGVPLFPPSSACPAGHIRAIDYPPEPS